MGLEHCGLNINTLHQELKPHGSAAFPCAGYEEYCAETKRSVPWHWHEELEIIFVQTGRLIVRIPEQEFIVEAGSAVVLNSNLLHSAVAEVHCRFQTLVFHETLITGGRETTIAQKYIVPLLYRSGFTGFLLKSELCERQNEHFCRAFEAIARDDLGYEITAREALTQIIFFLYQVFAKSAEPENEDLDAVRIRRMLDYIHAHYSEEIALADIAKAADIGPRESLRCFQRTVHMSAMQYLMKYRISQSAKLLGQDQRSSISDIAAACGFGSQSNYAKLFKRYYNCTPREYRNQCVDAVS